MATQKYPCGMSSKLPNFCKGRKCKDCPLNRGEG